MDRVDLESLVRLHEAELYRYVRYLGTESTTVAEDLVQETFLAVFKNPPSALASEPRQQAAWLRGIARNLFLMHCRRQRTNKVELDSNRLECAEVTWISEFLRGTDGFEYVEALRACLTKIAERQRTVLHLQYSQGKSRAEIATELQMSEDGVKSLLRRTRAHLADCIRRSLAQDAEQVHAPRR